MSRGMNIVTGHGNRTEEMFDVLRLIADPKQLEAAIKRIQDEQERLQGQIALAGKANEINDIHARLESDVERARTEVEEARAQAAQILADAEAEKTKRLEDGQAHVAELEKTAEKKLTDATKRQERAQKLLANVERKNTALESREKDIQRNEAELSRQRESVKEIKAQLLKEKSELATVRETLKQAVG